jgi:2,3-dihydroxybiphenyl 1,2-dioxygenase
MKIKSLGYVGFAARDLEAWRSFAQDLLGAQICDAKLAEGGKALRLRLDEKCQRMLITESLEESGPYLGFEVEDKDELARAERTLAGAGIAVERGRPAEAIARGVDDFLRLTDPMGQTLELYCGLADDKQGFVPSRAMGGFCAGDLGFGHAVLMTTDFDKSKNFYHDVLGFRISDFISLPNRRIFMHVNPRHHSLALTESPGCGIAHLLVEVKEFDDLGRAYDVALRDYPQAITSSLGRHSNDYMTSFYVRTPSGFALEYGWGGRLIGPDWQPHELFGPSLWGHDRRAGTAEARLVAGQQRQFAFEQGIRAPWPSRSVSPESPDAH